MSCTRSGCMLAIPFLSFVLALNRLLVIVHARANGFVTVVFKIAIVVAWVVPIPATLMINFVMDPTLWENRVLYVFYEGSFKYTGTLEFRRFMGYCGPAMEAAAFVLTVLVVIIIALEAFLICVPTSVVVFSGIALQKEIAFIPWVHIIWHVLAALIPAVNLMVFIIFNPYENNSRFEGLRRSDIVTLMTVMPKMTII
uniref:G protein-coupled receptor n=1 Tax=Steinernema glaseri TaxID=37863 RepID=A0A1I7ZRP3_9BILA